MSKKDPSSCKHESFESVVNVCRIIKEDDSDEVIGYSADVLIRCGECKLLFEFVGLPMGLSDARPMCSFDAKEARMPIKPSLPEGMH